MGELFKTQHTIDEMLDRMGVKIVLDSEHLTEEDKFEAEKQGSSGSFTGTTILFCDIMNQEKMF